jgi:hypothetical protein
MGIIVGIANDSNGFFLKLEDFSNVGLRRYAEDDGAIYQVAVEEGKV